MRNLGEFLFVLHARGWTVTPEHHSRVARLLECLGPDLASAKLKRLLCPIFATDAVQQHAFGAAYDDYFLPFPMIPAEQKTSDELVAERPPTAAPRRRRSLVLAGSAALALVIAVGATQTSSVTRVKSSPPRIKQVTSASSTGPRIVTLESDAAALSAQNAATTAPTAISPDQTGPFQECMVQGRLFREHHLHATAITTFRVASTLSPDNPVPLAEIAAIYEEMKLRDSAKQEWQKIYDMGPAKAGVYHELAGVMLNKFGSLALGVKDRKPHSQTPAEASAKPADDSVPHEQRVPPPSPSPPSQ